MRKIMMVLFMIVIILPSAFAGLEILSGSQIDFRASDSELSNEVFYVQVVENGGADRIYFSEFEKNLDSGFGMFANSGYIEGEMSNVRVEYPYFTRAKLYSIEQMWGGNTKIFFNTQNAYDRCVADSGTSNVVFARNGLTGFSGWGTYVCFRAKPSETATIYEMSSSDREYKWTETFFYNNPLDSIQNHELILTDEKTSNRFFYTNNREAVVKYSFSGVGNSGYPDDITSKAMIKESGLSDTPIDFISDANILKYDSHKQVINTMWKEILSSNSYVRFVQEGIEVLPQLSWTIHPKIGMFNLNQDLQSLLNVKSLTYSGYDINLQNGRVVMNADKTEIVQSPIFTLKLDAEWIGVYELVGRPIIQSFEPVNNKIEEGSRNALWRSKVKNDVDNEASFDYSFTCEGSLRDGVATASLSRQGFDANQIKTLTHEISSDVSLQDGSYECCLTVDDRNSVNSDKKCSTIQVTEADDCEYVGQQECLISGDIRNCIDNQGTLVWSPNIINCPLGCFLEGGIAGCEVNPDECNEDAVCDGTETFDNCPNDCSVPNDGYCSKIKNEDNSESANYSPFDCGCPDGEELNGFKCVPEDGSGGNLPIIIVSGLGGLGILGAGAFRLKKEGFF